MTTPDITAALLRESAWVQRLARSLVRDASTADDLAQDTLTEAIERPPVHADRARGWLATVLRRRILRRRRESNRRSVREASVARHERIDAEDATDDRVRRHKELAERVHALPEPYRTAIVLRYFDDLAPRDVATRLGVPVNTIQSRIRRGLALLRDRLDSEPGGREEWIQALTVIGWPQGVGGSTSVPLLGASVVMQLKLVSAAAVVIALAVWWSWPTSAPSETTDVSRATTVPSAPQSSPSIAPAHLDSSTVPLTPARVASEVRGEKPATHNETIRRGRVVDVRGRALPGVPILRHGALWPRWQGGDLGWITDGEAGDFLPPRRVEELRADAAAARTYFARYRNPPDWRFVVLGEALPGRSVSTDARGEFSFDDAAADESFAVADESWVVLAETDDSDGTTVLVVSPAVHVSGRVLSSGLQPVPNAVVDVHWSPRSTLEPTFAPSSLRRVLEPLAMNVDDTGRFVLRVVPRSLLGCEIRVTAPGHESRELQPPLVDRDDFDVILAGDEPARSTLDGVVLDPDSAPVAGAEVVFGRDRTTSAADGRFVFTDVQPVEDARLSVIHRGHAPIQRNGIARVLREDPRHSAHVELRFTTLARTLRGMVVDDRGLPLSGVDVNLFDPLLMDVSFTPLEARTGGWERAITTDGAGRFSLPGLASRAYRLRVFRPDSSWIFVSEPIASGADDVTVVVPGSAFHAKVRGRLTTPDGKTPDDASVAVSYSIHVTHDGGGSRTDGSSPVTVTTDGSFELTDVPRRDAELIVTARGIEPICVPVEAIANDGTLRVQLDTRRVLRILGDEPGATAMVVDDLGGPLRVESGSGSVPLETTSIVARDGRFDPVRIPSAASHVLVQRLDGSWERIRIVDDAHGLARAVVER